ncbi:MAG: PadR family transcriptional regulator [Fusicatenibacter sp.]|nr:PadR family transcriptional regulator [Fusicatenibacter sp.]
MNPQLKKGALELCVLSQLTAEDKYGYELTETISHEMSIAAGTLYMILKRLKEAEYVETYLIESTSGPARKYYHLTEKGRTYQQEKKEEWQTFTAMVNRLIQEGEKEL